MQRLATLKVVQALLLCIGPRLALSLGCGFKDGMGHVAHPVPELCLVWLESVQAHQVCMP